MKEFLGYFDREAEEVEGRAGRGRREGWIYAGVIAVMVGYLGWWMAVDHVLQGVRIAAAIILVPAAEVVSVRQLVWALRREAGERVALSYLLFVLVQGAVGITVMAAMPVLVRAID